MKAKDLYKELKKAVGDDLTAVTEKENDFVVVIEPAALQVTAKELKRLKFDYFSFVTAVDNLDRLSLIYRVYSLTEKQGLHLKVDISRKKPVVASVASIWGGANWHEREARDLFGIKFEGHPDPRPLVLPEGWSGHPLLKDYEDEGMIPRPEFY